MKFKVLIISPHPDDETLGCGGTILKHIAAGDEVYWLIMTNISVETGYDKIQVKKRRQEIDNVAKEYGFKKVFKLDLPTTKLDVIPGGQIIESVSKIINKVKPHVFYMPNRNDVHSDHKVTFDSVISSTKTFRNPFIKKIMMYETVSETEFSPPLQDIAFIPNGFSDISDYLDRKISIMKIYRNELGIHPFPRSIKNLKALATFRGATAGVKYAEAFMVLKDIW
ncbi:glucosamine-6-phosphate deaminase-like protein [bacterium BMS3Abin10]|nr:glucosamine-6-phosphate deaminase-like protein [bacterium BMS3Abin10]GBE39919.1 glucosamine-6-phosphate deaminase-like protein [bacterium BMS3Bbin08]